MFEIEFVLGDRPGSPFIAQPEIQGQFGRDPPVILDPRHELPLAVLRVEQFRRQLKILREYRCSMSAIG